MRVMVHLGGVKGQALGHTQAFRESVIRGLACVYSGFRLWMAGLCSDSGGAALPEAAVFHMQC